MNSTKIEPKYISKSNPRVGLIALASAISPTLGFDLLTYLGSIFVEFIF